MNRRRFLKYLGGTAGLWITGPAVLNPLMSAKRKPNFLIIFSDDHGKSDSGAYGNKVIKTPHIDRLARQGMMFSHAFAATAMCAPSRSSAYTGLGPHRHGCHMNHGSVNEGIRSIPHYLEPLGYRVGLAGKTHIKPKEAFPFEYFSSDIADVEQFLTSTAGEPFCLVVATSDPHAERVNGSHGFKKSQLYDPDEIPLPPYLVDTGDTRVQRAGYYDLVTRLDNNIGDFMGLLKSQGLDEETVVIYASDHGSGFPFEKWTCYEAGLNIPFIVRWPGVIPEGSATDAMVSLIDILPTLMDIGGGNPENQDFDGKSFFEVLRGNSRHHHEYIFGAHTTEGIIKGSYFPVRSVRDERFKYIRNLNPEGVFTNLITEGEFQAGWGSWKEKAKIDPFAARQLRKYQTRPPEEVYDLKHNPFEMHNLADDPAYQDVREHLSRILDRWMRDQDDSEYKS